MIANEAKDKRRGWIGAEADERREKEILESPRENSLAGVK